MLKIVRIDEIVVPLKRGIRNSLVDFSEHTVSLVAVRSDVVRRGRPVVGVAFNSIGRFAQGGLLRERFIPRVLAADPQSLLDDTGTLLDPVSVSECLMRNEKPGGHGDRAAAVSAVELACWDLNARLRDEPAYATIARWVGLEADPSPIQVYAAGGYYTGGGEEQLARLRTEFAGYGRRGYRAYKMKVGGAPLEQDLRRLEAVLDVVGDASALAVDANGGFGRDQALRYGSSLAPYGLRWYEEPCDPLDYGLSREVIETYGGPVATGENLFSHQDVRNLVAFGGMRPQCDVFQMDAGLSYGLCEYIRMIQTLEERGFDRKWAYPHGGHLINLHIVAGLGLGGCESYPDVFQPFGGYHTEPDAADGTIRPPDTAGFGLEHKPELADHVRDLME